MFKAAIIGASGYTGGELLRMLSNHPEVEVKKLHQDNTMELQHIKFIHT